MEQFKELLEKCWRDPHDYPRLMERQKKSCHDFKEIDAIPNASFVTSVFISYYKYNCKW